MLDPSGDRQFTPQAIVLLKSLPQHVQIGSEKTFLSGRLRKKLQECSSCRWRERWDTHLTDEPCQHAAIAQHTCATHRNRPRRLGLEKTA